MATMSDDDGVAGSTSQATTTTTTHTKNNNGLAFTLPQRLFEASSSSSSSNIVLECMDCHAGGEPARVVLSGLPSFPTNCTTALLKRNYMMEEWDHFRLLLLQEPRGYPCQNVNFCFRDTTTTNSTSSSSTNSTRVQYVIAEQNKIYPLMSGHNTICVATALLECNVIPMVEPISQFTLEAPAGPIDITARCCNGKAQSISFCNQAPSFVEQLDCVVQVPHLLNNDDTNGVVVKVDIAFGGMWYAIVDIKQFPRLSLDPSHGKELCRIGEMIKVACREQFPVQHPTEDYPGVDILAFRSMSSPSDTTQKQKQQPCYGKNVVIMSNNQLEWDKPETWTAMIDRSPCGTGTCAIMAVLHARGELKVGQPFVHESIVGSKFTGLIVEETTLLDGRMAIIPQVEGSAWITQYAQVVLDPKDPFPEGYRMGDIW